MRVKHVRDARLNVMVPPAAAWAVSGGEWMRRGVMLRGGDKHAAKRVSVFMVLGRERGND